MRTTSQFSIVDKARFTACWRVLSAATAIQPDTARAFFMVKNEPIPVFRHKTLLQLVQEGRTDDAIDYLESISAGFTG